MVNESRWIYGLCIQPAILEKGKTSDVALLRSEMLISGKNNANQPIILATVRLHPSVSLAIGLPTHPKIVTVQ